MKGSRELPFPVVPSAKSTIAGALAAMVDVNVIRSDVIRKALFAGGSTAPSDPHAYGQAMYSALASQATYERMFTLAQEDLKKGKSVVIDATFSRAFQRTQAWRIAAHRQATPVFVQCRAPEAILARELEICLVNIAVVTDYDVGVEGEIPPVTHTGVVEQFQASLGILKKAIETLIPQAAATPRACECATALTAAGG